MLKKRGLQQFKKNNFKGKKHTFWLQDLLSVLLFDKDLERYGFMELSLFLYIKTNVMIQMIFVFQLNNKPLPFFSRSKKNFLISFKSEIYNAMILAYQIVGWLLYEIWYVSYCHLTVPLGPLVNILYAQCIINNLEL